MLCQALCSLCVDFPAPLGRAGGGRKRHPKEWSLLLALGRESTWWPAGPVEQAAVAVGAGSCRTSRSVLLCGWALSCIAPSEVDSAGEEVGIQLPVELVRN